MESNKQAIVSTYGCRSTSKNPISEWQSRDRTSIDSTAYPHSKMGLWSAKTERSWKWRDVYFMTKIFQKKFGQRLQALLFFFAEQIVNKSSFKPKLMKLKVFGCLCFSYIPQVKRDKLDKKAEAGIFVGYSSTSKAYRIFLPQSNKVIVSRDVLFFEEEKWSKESEKLQVQEESEEDVDDQPVRGTRSLSDIYQRCNVAIMEPVDYNEAAISISKNPVFHGKTKHFKIKLYFLREVQKQGDVQLLYCKTENQLADFLTKSLPQARFEYLRQKLGVCCH